MEINILGSQEESVKIVFPNQAARSEFLDKLKWHCPLCRVDFREDGLDFFPCADHKAQAMQHALDRVPCIYEGNYTVNVIGGDVQ